MEYFSAKHVYLSAIEQLLAHIGTNLEPEFRRVCEAARRKHDNAKECYRRHMVEHCCGPANKVPAHAIEHRSVNS